MRLLKTDQQIELQQFLEQLSQHDFDAATKNQLIYWALELKPKRKLTAVQPQEVAVENNT